MISCSSESEKVGSFKANLKGSNAEQLAALIRERETTTLTLKNGLSLTLQVCTNDCSSTEAESTEAESRKPISNVAGIIIAVTFISVVLAGAILLMVILVRYRRYVYVTVTSVECKE